MRYNWNPIEKCAVQLKSYRKMCGTTGILEKTWQNEAQTLDPEILEKTSQFEPHPRDLRKSWKKPHNLSLISETAENPGKNLTILRICLLLVGWLVGCWFRQAVQRPLAGAIIFIDTVTIIYPQKKYANDTTIWGWTSSCFMKLFSCETISCPPRSVAWAGAFLRYVVQLRM